MRQVRQKATLSQRAAKETVWRAKRLTREMQAYWRRFDRAEKAQRRQQERQLEERARQDVALLEAKRAQRKLNFLITQTELYAHFMAKKIGGNVEEEKDEEEGMILGRLDEGQAEVRLKEIDDYDSQAAMTMARNNASQVGY